MPKVSVIIPTYNCARYVSEAIDSVLAQTYQNYEIIVVDDGSVDDTRQLVKNYLDTCPDKIKYFYQENKGPGVARNKGMEEAKGEYITFLDADDKLLPNSLLKRINFLYNHPNLFLVFSDYNIERSASTITRSYLKQKGFMKFFYNVVETKKEKEIILGKEFYYTYLMFSPMPICTDTVMIRKEIVKEVGLFRSDIFVGEDADYWIKVIKNRVVGYIDEPLATYRRYLSNLTKNLEKGDLGRVYLYKDLFKTNEEPRIRQILRKRLAHTYYSLGYYYKNQKLSIKARRCLFDSMRYNPFDLRVYKSFVGTFLLFEKERNGTNARG